jgi:NAD(P)-dependent dehydrogenase (short-subunit alcohol dehydrogenase family)
MAADELMSAEIPSLFRLEGCTAFVSGAAGHLGGAMARILCEAGAHVILNGRDDARLKRFQGGLDRNFSTEIAAFDVADFKASERFFAARPRLDVLVNNAIAMTPAPITELTPQAFDETYRSSVTAAFTAGRAALPALRAAAAANGSASIINISSMYGLVSPDTRIYDNPDHASPLHYGPAKAALLQLTRHLAAEFGKDNIRVNALVPGPFPRDGVAASDPAFAQRLGAKTMLGRTGKAQEIAGPLLFMASRASSYVTGTALTVDGGWTAW